MRDLRQWTDSSKTVLGTDAKLNVSKGGTYFLTITNGDCPGDSTPIVVTENKVLPKVVVSKSSDIDCANPTITLSGNGSETSGVTYLWSTTDGSFSGPVNQINATATSAGTSTTNDSIGSKRSPFSPSLKIT